MKHKIFYEREELFDVNMLITMIVKVKGGPSDDELKSAFDGAVKVNGILNSKIVIEPDGSAYYVDNDAPRSSFNITQEDLIEVKKREEKIRFRLEDGEFIRAFARRDEDITSIMFLMHHMGGDGKSLVYFIEDFMSVLSGQSREYKEIRTAETVDSLDPISKTLLKHYNKGWNGQVFTFEDMDKAYESYWKDRTTDLQIEVIEKDEMTKILDECRAAGVKYTSYLTAMLIKDEKDTQDIGYATDYRHDGNRSMGNQASGVSVKHKYDPGKSLMDNALKIQKKLAVKLDNDAKASYILNFSSRVDPTLYDAVCLEHAGTFHDKTSYKLARLLGFKEKTKDYSITNLTVADIPVEYGRFTIDELLFAGPVVSYGKNIISVVTCNGKTVITRHSRKG